MQTLALRSLTRLHSLRPKLFLHCSTTADDLLHRRRQPERRQHEEEWSARVMVWWDFENCSIPRGVDASQLAPNITSALHSNGIKGSVTINAFGDIAHLPHTTQMALNSTGVFLMHVPQRGKNSAGRFCMADIVHCFSHDPPPMHFFLITADEKFAGILHQLKMQNYNILLATSDHAQSVLSSSATITWRWDELVRGLNV